MQELHVALQIEDFLFQVVGVCIEFLTERHWNCILQLGTAHLDDICIFVCLVAECADQTSQSTYQVCIHTNQSQTDRGWVNVVGALSTVAMVVRRAELIVTLLVTHDFECTVSNHLVGIHINRSTCTALYHVDREVLMPFAFDDLAASLRDRTRNFIVDHTEGMVGLDSCQLHVSDSDDEIRVSSHSLTGNVIVVDTALCLYTVKCFSRNFEFT